MSVSDEQMLVVRSLRQAFEMYATGGGAVQANVNPFFITVNGTFDLLKTGDLVIANLDNFRAHKQKLADAEQARHLAAAAKELALATQQDQTDPQKG